MQAVEPRARRHASLRAEHRRDERAEPIAIEQRRGVHVHAIARGHRGIDDRDDGALDAGTDERVDEVGRARIVGELEHHRVARACHRARDRVDPAPAGLDRCARRRRDDEPARDLVEPAGDHRVGTPAVRDLVELPPAQRAIDELARPRGGGADDDVHRAGAGQPAHERLDDGLGTGPCRDGWRGTHRRTRAPHEASAALDDRRELIELVEQRECRGRARVRVARDEPADQIRERPGHAGQRTRRRGRDDALHELAERRRVVQRVAGDEPDRGRAETVQIAAWLDVAGERLGRHVRRRAARTLAAGEAEIDEHRARLGAIDEQDVRGRHVAMHQARRVNHGERARDVGEQHPHRARIGPRPRITAPTGDPLGDEERRARRDVLDALARAADLEDAR